MGYFLFEGDAKWMVYLLLCDRKFDTPQTERKLAPNKNENKNEDFTELKEGIQA